MLSHHNQDATHIAFGVATMGWMNRLLKIDASIFTGREPDEERYDFDRPRFDSYSLRIAYDPTRFLSAQVSAGFLKGPEALEPDEDLVRGTASILHARPFPKGRILSSGLVYGGNFHPDGEVENSFTVESEWDWNLGTVYGRLEAVQKTGEDLVIAPLADRTFWTSGVTFGSSIRLFRRFRMMTALGAQGTLNSTEEELHPYYGEFPLSFEVFLKISPDIMRMEMAKEKEGGGGRHGHGMGGHGTH